jgi:hypothetical protein
MLPDEVKDRTITLIREWVERLAADDYQGALDMLYTARIDCTVAIIRRAIAEYSIEFFDASEEERAELLRQGRAPRISSRTQLPPGESYEFYELKSGIIHIDYTLPVDGEWSDLSAQFEFFFHGGELVMELRGIRVM